MIIMVRMLKSVKTTGAESMKYVSKALLLTSLLLLGACEPEVGSDAWCEKMAEKPKGEWTASEAGDYTKHCIFKSNDK
jgi:hypothetical protein